jgi:DNA-binding CsgD family transcriptional regulator
MTSLSDVYEDRIPVVKVFRPALLGFGLFWTWVFLCFDPLTFNNWSFLGVRATLWAHLISLLATIPVYLLMAFAHRFARQLLSRWLSRIALLILMALGTFLYAFPALSPYPVLQLLGALLTGLSSPFLLLLWSEVYGSLEVRPVIVYTALSFLIAELLYLLISALPLLGMALLTPMIPLLSFTALLMNHLPRNAIPQPSQFPRKHQFPQKLTQLLSLRILCGFLTVMFIYGASLAFYNAWGAQETIPPTFRVLPLILVVGVVLCAGLLVRNQGLLNRNQGLLVRSRSASPSIANRALNLGVAYRLSLLFIAATFIPLALLGNSFPLPSAFFASAGINAIEILTWILLTYMASTSTIPRFAVFAICMAVFHIGMAAGEITGILLINHALALSLLAICALIALAGFAFTDRDTTIHFGPLTRSEMSGMVARSSLLQSAVRQIAHDFALSEREREVFALWSAGYGAKAIEKKLFISSSTVKTHIQHIYEKCAVHSRTESITLLENYLLNVKEDHTIR